MLSIILTLLAEEAKKVIDTKEVPVTVAKDAKETKDAKATAAPTAAPKEEEEEKKEEPKKVEPPKPKEVSFFGSAIVNFET